MTDKFTEHLLSGDVVATEPHPHLVHLLLAEIRRLRDREKAAAKEAWFHSMDLTSPLDSGDVVMCKFEDWWSGQERAKNEKRS